jgi:hypothetical protein
MKTSLPLMYAALVSGSLALTACERSTTPTASTVSGSAPMQAPAASAVISPTSQASVTASGVPDSRANPTSGGRELVNPDASTVVFLYYELAHIPLPLDEWVEEDGRVRFAPAPQKAAQRAMVRAEIESGAAAVKGVGSLRLTMNANLSDYDPTYGEFSVRALAPSSQVTFEALHQKVAVSFSNGRTAQIWRVPADQAQAIRDKIGVYGSVDLDALLHIKEVLPAPGGGTIVTEVIEYEMRQTQSGVLIGRVRATQS